MSFGLPDAVVLPASPERPNIAVAEIVIFAAVLPVQPGVRYVQIWRRKGATGSMNPLRCFLRAWLNFIVVFAQIWIVGFALYLGVKNPSKGVVVAEVVLQSVRLSPLLPELGFTLLRCGRAATSDYATTIYPKVLKRMLQYARVPIVIAVILIIVAGSILNLSCLKAGAVLLLATYIYVACIAIPITFRYKERFVKTAQIGLWITVASLPLYAIRVIYLMLVEFKDGKFDPVVGDWRYLADLGFAMEMGIVVLLVIAGPAVGDLGIRGFDWALPMTHINSAGAGKGGMFSDQ